MTLYEYELEIPKLLKPYSKFQILSLIKVFEYWKHGARYMEDTFRYSEIPSLKFRFQK